MKKAFDVLAVLILGMLMYYFIDLMAGIISTIPNHVWATLGNRLMWCAGVVIGFWALLRGTRVLGDWYKKFREGTLLTKKVTHSNTTGDRI